uniref:Endoribonuclease n=1 Tax=Acrobeloides nanus TaxID=290746 RepID=A0A914EHQ8_9BILA
MPVQKYIAVAAGPDVPKDKFPLVYNQNDEEVYIVSTESYERAREENSYTWKIMKILVSILCLLLIFQIIRAQIQKQKRIKFQAGHTTQLVSDSDITNILNHMSNIDVNSAKSGDIVVDYQNMASHTHFDHDNAPNPFFTSVSSTLLQKNTYQALSYLLQQYNTSDIDTADTTTTTNPQAISSFLSKIGSTNLYSTAMQFLKNQNLVPSDPTQTLMDLWFNPYAINSVKGSSGFKHVFAGASQGITVLGLNNWVRFYQLEQQSSVNYHGWFARQEDVTISMQFAWGNLQALMQNFTIGASPEFDFCAYTICALSSPASLKSCTYQNAGYTITLEVETINDNGVTRIKHASPYVGKASGGVTPTPQSGSPGTPSTDSNFQDLVNKMRAADVDRAQPSDITINWGTKLMKEGKASKSSGPLIAYVNEQLFQRPVYSKLITIYNQSLFVPNVCTAEMAVTGFKKAYLDDYLKTLTNTSVFQLAYNYLVSK